jgi:adenylate cyclase
MLYSNYTDRIKNIVSEKRKSKLSDQSFYNANGRMPRMPGPEATKKLISEQRAFSNKSQINLQPLSSILQTLTNENAKLGHPDFNHLKGTDKTEYHYIVSAFIDIEGSTNLHKEYELEDIYRITNTIQSAAIQTCIALGGHVQRLQGDGVFAYFGGKYIAKDKAVEMAVTACSMFTYFVKNDLKNVFLEDGIEDIKTRIGIDFGNDEQVLWANFGILDVSELTTLSLYTSNACKMQGYASSNGIVVGQNIKDRLTLDAHFYDYVKNSKGEITKRYIFENNKTNFRYTQYTFDWFKYLKTLPFVKADANGNLQIVDPSEAERINRLQNTAAIISSGGAYLNRHGNITNDSSGVQHQPHRFHYGK